MKYKVPGYLILVIVVHPSVNSNTFGMPGLLAASSMVSYDDKRQFSVGDLNDAEIQSCCNEQYIKQRAKLFELISIDT